MMVVIGGYLCFCICDLDEQATIQEYIDISDARDASHHICKTTLEQWRQATGITKDQEVSFVTDKVFPRKAQCEHQRFEEEAAKERERVEQEKKATDALRKEVSLVQNPPVFSHTSQMQTHSASTPNVF
jgi:hypothetical protein